MSGELTAEPGTGAERVTRPGPTATVERLRGLRATMPDGVELVADLWRLPGSGPAPVLLQRLPYGRSVASSPVLPAPSRLARRGYAVVVQDVRGTGDSGGVFDPFRHEAADGAATIEWAATQGFCDGNVATYGFSYQGTDQVAAAALRPAGLRAIAPMMCGASFYELVYEDGCLLVDHATRWAAQLGAIADGVVRTVDPSRLPVHDALGDDPPEFFREWMCHGRPDDPFWSALAPDLGAVAVPSFVVLGYADTFAKASARLATALGAEVVAGPWAHMPWGSRLGELELGPDAGPAAAHEGLLDFFDRTLRGGGRPTAPARIYVGGEGWRGTGSWPPEGTRLVLRATSAGDAASRHGDGRLEATPSSASSADELVAEPLAPHPAPAAPYPDVAAAEDRRDVLCYTSPPFERSLVVAGSPMVVVTVAADAPSFDVCAALALAQGATARRLTIGSARVEAAQGAATEVSVELGPIAWRVPSGARLRLELAASGFPLYGRNPQSGAPAAVRAEHLVATIRFSSATLELTELPLGDAGACQG